MAFPAREREGSRSSGVPARKTAQNPLTSYEKRKQLYKPCTMGRGEPVCRQQGSLDRAQGMCRAGPETKSFGTMSQAVSWVFDPDPGSAGREAGTLGGSPGPGQERHADRTVFSDCVVAVRGGGF